MAAESSFHSGEPALHRVMTIYGTRPEAIKMAPLIAAVHEHPAMEAVVAVTGQHREMLDQVNELFGIVPDHDLDLMTHGATLAAVTSRTLTATTDLLERTTPDLVVVQGDTSSAFTAALAAFYQRIPVVHLEAGLRTGDIYSPFPEEVNRRLTAPIAALHLAPTATSRQNLVSEGIDPAHIAVTGNTVIDALRTTIGRPVDFADPRVALVVASGQPILLVTSHRRESWGPRMTEAMGAVRTIAERHPELRVLLPLHRNALVRDVIEPALAGLDNVLLTEPLSYHEFAHVLQFTNPQPTTTALDAFGGDSETMADCYALTYLPGWKLHHRVWVSSYQYYEVDIGYGYTCNESQRQVVRDWYEQLGYTTGPIAQS